MLEPSQLLEFGSQEQCPRDAALVLENEHSVKVELNEVMMQLVLFGDLPRVAVPEYERFGGVVE